MRLTFLGTSSGAPTRTRNVTALAVAPPNSKRWYLVDCGEGTQHQLLRTPLKAHHLGGVMITHLHGDHCYGLPGLLASAAIGGRSEPLTIIGPPQLETMVRTVLDVSAAHLPYALEFVDVEAMPWRFEDFVVESVPLSHRIPSYAYCLREVTTQKRLDVDRLAVIVPRGPAWGALQRGETVYLEDGTPLDPQAFLLPAPTPARLVIAGDNDTPELLAERCRDTDVLVHEATYVDDLLNARRAVWQHSSAGQVARFAAQHDLPNLVLTHFSARFQTDPQASVSITDVEREARSVYTGRLHLARDFDVFELRDGLLEHIGGDAKSNV
jgi:ribonuclease Z